MEFNPVEINEQLPYLLRRENIARYEDGRVLIGDRRRYPFAKEFVECGTLAEVAAAIKGMVTQGGGPWVAASYALAMVARENSGVAADRLQGMLREATQALKDTRPTSIHLHRLVERALAAGERGIAQGVDVEQAILDWVEGKRDDIHIRSAMMGKFGADMVPDGGGVLTMCFAETAFLLGLSYAASQGKTFEVYVPETRPYLQGARLTAPSIREIGIRAILITDNMPGYVVSSGKVQVFFTGADLVTLDGHVVNKIGTFQNALACQAYGIPYFAYCWEPDFMHPDRDSIIVEERNPDEIKSIADWTTTIPEIEAYYPAFDITPPHLVAGVITKFGISSPFDLARHFGEGQLTDD